jgi:hypothetical protein
MQNEVFLLEELQLSPAFRIIPFWPRNTTIRKLKAPGQSAPSGIKVIKFPQVNRRPPHSARISGQKILSFRAISHVDVALDDLRVAAFAIFQGINLNAPKANISWRIVLRVL